MSFEDQIAQADTVGIEDFDGDGYRETMLIDETGDGVADTAVTMDVETGTYSVLQVADDGSSVSLVYDSEGYVTEAAFVDSDGSVLEMSGDGLTDFLAEFGTYTGTDVPIEVDVTDDGTGDPTVDPEVPTDPYGEPEVYDGDPVSQVPIQTDPEMYTTVDEVTESQSYQDWMAELDTDGDGYIGDVSDTDFWFEQSTGFTCGPAAITQIIEDFTGADLPNELEVAEYAADHGYLSENGMVPDDAAQVLTDAGVPSEVKYQQSWEDLAGYLEDGRSVVMFVDSSEYWDSTDDGANTVDHFVRIVAIDPEAGVAILSDSGTPNGQQLEVPIETLDDAWNSAVSFDEYGQPVEDRVLIVSDDGDPTLDEFGTDPYEEPIVDEVAVDPYAEPGADPTQIGSNSIEEGQSLDIAGGLPGTEDEGLVERVFSNPVGWVLVPVTLAASRIFGAMSSKNK